ncbi:MAG: DUF3854 domain-containing protein [Planctomycetes bacterium]|nr:DUF3854 domain-containing protein [Planctomycetota bacterium]
MSISSDHRAYKWHRVTRSHPCPVCGKPDWCSVAVDGTLAACRRVAPGAWRAKTDRAGVPVYLHSLGGEARAPSAPLPPPDGPAPDRAGADSLHRVYSVLLGALTLGRAHRDSLRGRGLSDTEVDRRGYRTLPVQGRARLTRDLHECYGDVLLRVPGIITRERDGRRYLSVAGAAGLLVPVRDVSGRIVALIVRRDGDREDGPRYSYLSSRRYGGPGPGAPVHVPLGVTGACHCCRLTEGAIKADVAHALSGLPTIGAPGVSAWRPALDVLRELDCQTVRLAFDGDARDNPAVARALSACAEAATAAGLAVELERWPREHKGIDDALAAGAAVELLAGEEARRAIAGVLAEATAGEPLPEPSPLERLPVILAGEPEALYRDSALLRALAQLAESDPAEYACRRAQLQRAGIRLRDLDRALSPLRREIRAAQPPPDAAGTYRIVGGRIVHARPTPQGPVDVPLATWAARIVEQTIHDDGDERRVLLAIEGALCDGTPLPRAEVPARDYPWMRWPVECWGTRAVVLAGASTADHLRAAIQLLSGDVPTRTVYGHTGWREVGGRWLYLHSGGAIGPDGPVADIEVSLPEALAGYILPYPPDGDDLRAAVRASLRLLDLAPDRITAPLLGAVCRGTLAPADYALHLCGPTGTGKTELSALAQQHHGAGLDARHLPGSWSSTGNSLEALAFAAADALLVVDDFAPSGSVADVARVHREADRLLRAQGNRSGRARCRTDGTVRPTRMPRGTILSTGEDVPRGQSLRARLLVLELAPGELDWPRLTACQRDAAAGLYAVALAGYVRWLAPRYPGVRDGLRAETGALRERVQTEGLHARTPGILADLAAGWHHWLDYALAVGAIDTAEREALARRVWAALLESGAAQAEHVAAADPVEHYLRLLAGALASGRAHVADPDGEPPADPEGWGWRQVTIGTGQYQRDEWQPQGRRIGWRDGADVYLEPEASYAEAQELARQQGDSLGVTARTLWRRLRERGLLAGWDTPRQRSTVRRTLEGVRSRDVLHLRADTLSACARPSTPSTDRGEPGDSRGDAVDGRVDSQGGPCCDRPQDRPHVMVAGASRDAGVDGVDGRAQGETPTARIFPPRRGGGEGKHR